MLLACTTMANAATPQQLQDLDATVERVRTQFDVPGIAVAIVKDGQIVLERGYGVLHTMGEAWLVADLDGYLKKRGGVA